MSCPRHSRTLLILATALALQSAPHATAQCGSGVYGFSVTTHWTGTNNNIWGGWGDIVLHRIENDAVVYHKTIYDGEAMFPVINQEGTQVAFIVRNGTGGKIAVCDTSGGNLQVYEGSAWANNDTRSQGGYCDWPSGRWVYHSKGGFYDDGSQEVHRVNADNGSTGLAMTFTNGDNGSKKARQWLWSMSADGGRMSLRVTDDDINSDQYGAIFYLNVPGSFPATVALKRLGGTYNSHYVTGCQNALSAGGTAMCYGAVSDNHRRIRVKEWWVTSSTDLESWDASQVHAWLPSSTNAGGEFNRNRWSNNSDDWMCAMEGWGTRGTNGCNQVLYNWRAHRQLVVTTNVANTNPKQFDCAGDFHLDTCVQSTEPVLRVSPTSLAFSCDEGSSPSSQQVTASNAGGGSLGTVTATDNAPWLTVSVDGLALTNTVDASSLSEGTYDAVVTVSATGAAANQTYSVSLTVRGVPVLSTVTINPTQRTVAGGAQVQFTASALDQYGVPLAQQPSLTWAAPDGGVVTQAGLFTAPQGEAVYRVTATATLGAATRSATAEVTVSAFLFQDDFSDGNDDGWTRGHGTWAVQSQAYVNTSQDASGNSFSYAGSTDWTDITYTIDVTPTSGSTQWVLFRVQDADHFMLFQLSDASVYRHNGAADWTQVASGSGSFTTGQTYAIEIVLDGAGITITSNGSAVVSTSDNTFTSGAVGVGGYESTASFDNITVAGQGAVQPDIVLISPNGGETFHVGDTLHVRWSANLDVITSALLQISFDLGENYFALNTDSAIYADDSDWGNYVWVIPSEVMDGQTPVSTLSDQCLVMVSDYQVTMTDQSLNTFTIQPAGTVSGARPQLGPATRFTAMARPDSRLLLATDHPGGHDITVVAMDGTIVARFAGNGPAAYRTRPLAAGTYLTTWRSDAITIRRRVTTGLR